MNASSNWADKTSPALTELVSRDPIVIVPIGAVEQHGNHLPVGTDAFAVESVARSAAGRWSGERPVVVLPTLWTGLSPHHMGLGGSITLRSETLISLVRDVCTSVLHHGARRILLLNGHGGNIAALDVVLTRLGELALDVDRVAAVTYWYLVGPRAGELRTSGRGGTGHAGEFETSLMLATHSALVEMDQAVTVYPELPSSYLSSDLFETGTARRFIPFDRLSASGTLGDPSVATREKGERILDACTEELIAFLEDFSGW